MATTKTSRKPATTPAAKPRSTVRQRLGGVLDGAAVETALDRILTRRLRPLRDDAKAARLAFEEQAMLRAEAEIRAARAEEEAETLRVRIATLEGELAAARHQPTGWWRRRRVPEQQPA